MEIVYNQQILGLLCNWCCYTIIDSAGTGRYQYPPNLRVICIMCTAGLDSSLPLEGPFRAADAARGRRIRTSLINACREIMKHRNFS